MKSLLKILLWASIPALGLAQQVILQQPDCQIFVSQLTTATSTTPYDNRFVGCSFWSFSYNSSGFSGLTVAVQAAPNVQTTVTNGAPGSWTTFGGSTTTGSNPNTTITSAYWVGEGYYPWMRVNLSGLTGTGFVSGTLYGWMQRPGGSGGGGSGCSDPCTVIQPDASLLNATVQGQGTAGTPTGGVLTIQGNPMGTPVPISGSLTPSGLQNVNVTQFGSVAVVTGGVTGSQGVGGLAASGATAAGNPIAIGGTFLTTQPTVTNGQAVTGQYSARGTMLVTPGVEGFPVTITPSGTQNVNLTQVGSNAVVTGGVNGSQGVGGLAADGAAVTGNPVLQGGFDGTNVQDILTDTSGRQISVGAAATAAAVVGNPVLQGGQDTSGNVRAIQTDTSGATLLGAASTGFGDSQSNTQFQVKGTGGNPAVFQIFPYMLNSGGSWDRQYKCDTFAPITLTTGTTQIVALSSNTNIRVCHISLGAASPVNVSLVYGTGSNCGTGTTSISGVYQGITSMALDFSSPSPLVVPVSQALCVTLGASVNTNGLINYSRF